MTEEEGEEQEEEEEEQGRVWMNLSVEKQNESRLSRYLVYSARQRHPAESHKLLTGEQG